MPKLITPTVGRVVWYWPSQHEIDARGIAVFDKAQPLAATVAMVYNDRLVNLSVVDHAGAQFRRTSVKLLQEDDERPHTSEGPFAEWMPFQRAQHAQQTAEAEETARWASVSEYQGQAPVMVAVDPAERGAEQTVETTVEVAADAKPEEPAAA